LNAYEFHNNDELLLIKEAKTSCVLNIEFPRSPFYIVLPGIQYGVVKRGLENSRAPNSKSCQRERSCKKYRKII